MYVQAAPPPAPTSREARPSATSPVGGADDPWGSLEGILESAAREAGRTVDVGPIIERFKRAVRAYDRDKAEPKRLAVKKRRSRLRQLETALGRLESALEGIDTTEASERVAADDSVLGGLQREWSRITGIPVPIEGHEHL